MITPSFGLTATERVLPKVALDFTTGSLDGRITFTRTTDATHPATYVNSSGSNASAANTVNKYEGLFVWDTTNNRLMRSSGALATST